MQQNYRASEDLELMSELTEEETRKEKRERVRQSEKERKKKMCACAFPLLGIFDSVVTAAQTELENGRQRRVSASPSF